MKEITEALLKRIDDKLEDCSNPNHIREMFGRYRLYLYSGTIFEMFINRIQVVRYLTCDADSDEALDSIESDLELERDIVTTCQSIVPQNRRKRSKRHNIEPATAPEKLTVQICVESEVGSVYEDVMSAAYLMALEKANGNKNEAARLLGLDYGTVNQKIKTSDHLKRNLKRIRYDAKKENNLPKV